MNKSDFKNPVVWVLIGLMAVAVIFIVSGIVNSDSEESQTAISSSSDYDIDAAFEDAKQDVAEEEDYDYEDSSEEEDINLNTPSSIGESRSFTSEDGDAITVTIDSVEKDTGDGDYYIPENGYYAKVSFTVTNDGTDSFDVNSHSLEFYDGNNMKAELNSRDFYSDTIQPGKSASGIAYFDVKNDTSDYEVFFADASWTGVY